MSIRSSSVVIGAFKDGGAGIRVAQPGYDANADPVDNSKLIFSSDWAGSMPIHFISPVTRVLAGQSKTILFPTLGYLPFAVGMYKFTFDPGFVTLFNEYSYDAAGSARRMEVRADRVIFSQGAQGAAIDFFAIIYRARAFT